MALYIHSEKHSTVKPFQWIMQYAGIEPLDIMACSCSLQLSLGLLLLVQFLLLLGLFLLFLSIPNFRCTMPLVASHSAVRVCRLQWEAFLQQADVLERGGAGWRCAIVFVWEMESTPRTAAELNASICFCTWAFDCGNERCFSMSCRVSCKQDLCQHALPSIPVSVLCCPL